MPKAFLCGLLFLAAWLAAPAAYAQTIRLTGTSRETSTGAPDQDARPPQYDPSGSFNYADCVGDKEISFALTVNDPSMASDHLVVLAGPSIEACVPAAGVKTTPAGCWPVVDSAKFPLAASMNVTVRAQDVTAFLGAATVPSTYTRQSDPIAACRSQTCPGPVTLFLTFLIEGTNDEVPAAEDPGSYGPLVAGTLGPQAPANVAVSVGTGSTTLTWTPPEDSTIYGYYVYCQNYGKIDSAVPDGTAAAPADACSDSQPGCVNAYDAGVPSYLCPSQYFTNIYTVPACTGTSNAFDAGTTQPDASEAGVVVVTPTIDGAVPVGPINTNAGISQIPGAFICASPTSTLDGATTLGSTIGGATVPTTNYDFYVFAVAAVDILGNVGPVGNLQCGTPGPIADFWYNYATLDGGQAGGGYCALEGVGMPAGSACMAVGVGFAAFGLLRRRRRRQP